MQLALSSDDDDDEADYRDDNHRNLVTPIVRAQSAKGKDIGSQRASLSLSAYIVAQARTQFVR